MIIHVKCCDIITIDFLYISLHNRLFSREKSPHNFFLTTESHTHTHTHKKSFNLNKNIITEWGFRHTNKHDNDIGMQKWSHKGRNKERVQTKSIYNY